jgi:CDP-glycerol glycerophosphotransferase (TagB/SpsB family)
MESAKSLAPLIDKTIRDDEVWFCKPHEFIGKDILNQLHRKNLVVVTSYDITPFLHLADVLVSDTSSVIYEFMVLDKPVVTLNTLSREDKGINIHSPGELRSAIDRSLDYPLEFSERRRNHLKEVNPRLDGSISANIIDKLLGISRERPSRRRRKPLNLFRKIQILYHSRFRKGYLR